MVGLKHVAVAALMVGIGLSATDAGAVTAYVGRGKATDAGSAVADWIADVTGYSETFGNNLTGGSPSGTIPLPSQTLTATATGSGTLVMQVGNATAMTGTNQNTLGGTGTSSTLTTSANNRGITLSGFSAASHAFGFYLQNIGASNTGVAGSAPVTITLTDNHGSSSITLQTTTTGPNALSYSFAADSNGNGIHTTGNGDQFISFFSATGSMNGGSGLSNLGLNTGSGSIFIGFSNIETASSITISQTASAKWEIGDFFCSTAPSRVLFALDTSVGANSCDTGVPEPASMAILGLGLAGLGAIRRRRKAA